MKTVWQSRATQGAAKYGEHAQTAAVCCNACRTCVQTNLIGLGIAAVMALGAGAARLVRRPASRA